MSLTAAELVASKKHILLDFDGPVCAAFAGYGAENISRQLAMLMTMEGVVVPAELSESADPFELLRYAEATGDPDVVAEVDSEFRRLEVQSVRVAPPTPDAIRVIRALAASGHTITIVSNNSAEAIESYARRHRISDSLAGICARASGDLSLLKPSPHLLLEALESRSAAAVDCVMVGDSRTDVLAAHAAAVAAIALANKPAKVPLLTAAEPAAVIEHMRALLPT